MDKRQIIIFGLLLFILSGCWDTMRKNRSNDEFYSYRGGWDWIRVPLLKPYEAIKANPELDSVWIVDLQSKNLGNVAYVKKVDVKDSLIFILSGIVDDNDHDSTYLGTVVAPTVWYVIDTKQKIEKGFLREEEFKAYMDKNNYSPPKWYNLDSLSDALGKGKKLPWEPK